MIKKILCLILCLSFFTLPVFGAESMTAVYSYEENKITVNADTGIANGDVAIYVLEQSVNPDTMSDSSLPLAAEYTAANGEGKISGYEMYLSNQLVFGNTYKVYLYYGTTGVLSSSFSYLTLNDRILRDISKSSDWSALKAVITGRDENNTQVNTYNISAALDFTYYNQLNSPSKVFVNMYNRKSEITQVSHIATMFFNESKACYEAENPPYDGGGFGGGSSSMGSYPVTDTAVPPSQTETKYFNDMENHWAKDTVYAMAQRGIVNGFETGDFLPENSVTRAEFAKMTVCAFGLLREAPNTFSDVEEGAWYEEYISAASSMGLVSGHGGRFYPNDKITREDAAVILYNTLKKIGSLSGDTRIFGDEDSISDYAKEAVSYLAGNNIISGTGEDTFSPKKDTTRAEAATLIYRACLPAAQ